MYFLLTKENSCCFHSVGPDAEYATVEESAVLLLQTFKDAEGQITRSHTQELRSIFGPFPASAASNALRAVQSITIWLRPGVLEKMFDLNDAVEATNSKLSPSSKLTRFATMKFNVSPNNGKPGCEEDWSEHEDDDDFFTDINIHLCKYEETNINMKYEESTERNGEAANSIPEKKDTTWLFKLMTKQYANKDVPVSDICASVFDCLTSSKTDDALQNDVSIQKVYRK